MTLSVYLLLKQIQMNSVFSYSVIQCLYLYSVVYAYGLRLIILLRYQVASVANYLNDLYFGVAA